jgi:hypothetical protein
VPLGLGGKQLSEMYGELINLKSEYKILKGNYSKLFSEKNEAKAREE